MAWRSSAMVLAAARQGLRDEPAAVDVAGVGRIAAPQLVGADGLERQPLRHRGGTTVGHARAMPADASPTRIECSTESSNRPRSSAAPPICPALYRV